MSRTKTRPTARRASEEQIVDDAIGDMEHDDLIHAVGAIRRALATIVEEIRARDHEIAALRRRLNTDSKPRRRS